MHNCKYQCQMAASCTYQSVQQHTSALKKRKQNKTNKNSFLVKNVGEFSIKKKKKTMGEKKRKKERPENGPLEKYQEGQSKRLHRKTREEVAKGNQMRFQAAD